MCTYRDLWVLWAQSRFTDANRFFDSIHGIRQFSGAEIRNSHVVQCRSDSVVCLTETFQDGCQDTFKLFQRLGEFSSLRTAKVQRLKKAKYNDYV
jgi:hypothetical protein